MKNNKTLENNNSNTFSKKRLPYPTTNATENDLPKISSIFLILTRSCNLHCKYCFVDKEQDNISYSTALDAVEFIAKNAAETNDIPSINFFGGEPTLRWNDIIVPLTNYIKQKYGENFNLSMTSNGILLDDNKLEFMKKNNIGLLFSMDGNKKTQDLNRPMKCGGSSFDILKKRIPSILKYYPYMTFRSTTDHDNVHEFFNNHKFAVEQGFTNIFNIVNVFAKWSDEEKEELKHQIDMLGEYYAKLKLENRKVSFNPFEEMFQKLNRIKEANENGCYRTIGEGLLAYGRCGLGANKFASVGTDGTLYSCQEMVGNKISGKNFIIGNIYDGEDNTARLNICRKFDIKNVICSAGKDACTKCKLNNVCDGSCVINNYFTSGSFNIMPSILCFYYQTLLNKANDIKFKYDL